MSNEDRDGFEQEYEEIQNLMEEEDEMLEDSQTEPDWNVEDDSEEQEQKPKKGSVWKWVVIAAAVLVVVVAVLLIGKIGKSRNNKETATEVPVPVETETETAGPGQQQTEAVQPAPAATPTVTPKPVPSVSPEKTEESKPAGNTVVIPVQLVYVGSTQEELDHYAEEYGLKSVTTEADGSVKVLSETTVPSADVDALIAKINEKCGEQGWYFHFLSISANNDQTVFSIVVNELIMSNREKQTVTDLFLTAGIHAVQSGQKAENLRIDLLNQMGEHIGTIITGPLKLGN